MVSGLMENLFNGPQELSQQRAMNDNGCDTDDSAIRASIRNTNLISFSEKKRIRFILLIPAVSRYPSDSSTAFTYVDASCRRSKAEVKKQVSSGFFLLPWNYVMDEIISTLKTNRQVFSALIRFKPISKVKTNVF